MILALMLFTVILILVETDSKQKGPVLFIELISKCDKNPPRRMENSFALSVCPMNNICLLESNKLHKRVYLSRTLMRSR